MSINNFPYDRRLNDRARQLRRDMTPQERHLWFDFLQQYPIKFYKQRVIHYYIADFYCAKAKLVIELDGSQHYTEQGRYYDAERDAILKGYNLKVLRFSNHDIAMNFEGVCDAIDREIHLRCAFLD